MARFRKKLHGTAPALAGGESERRSATSGAALSARTGRAAERRATILAAALHEFSAAGFAATRLDDVARRAGVAKGTIYLYFKDKEALFQDLIRFNLMPVMGAFEAALKSDLPLRTIVDQAIEIFVREIYGTHRKEVMRLIITEGARFPSLAEFYYREVLAPMLAVVRARLTRALDRGEIKDKTLIRFPQVIGAASVMVVVWHGLFDRFEPLDVRAILRLHFEGLLGNAEGRS
jgi:AcrR family transcriptional regulator